MKSVSSKIEVSGFGLDKNIATRLLDEAGIKSNTANIKALVGHAKDDSPKNQYLNLKELTAAIARLIDERRPDIKPTHAIQRAIDAAPASLKRYEFNLVDTDGNERKDFLTIDPLPLKKQKSTNPMIRGLTAKSKGSDDDIDEQIGHTWRGGITLQFKGPGGKVLDFSKGKWVTSSFEEMLIGRPDREEAIAKLKADGYNITAQRDFLSVTVDGHKDPIVLGMRSDKDKKAVIEDGSTRFAPHLGNIDKRDYGFVSICAEVNVEQFGDQRIITVKKPVIYLYPEKKTQVKVHVAVQGEFSAQYPATKNGTWEMIATPDGTLFDPKTEKRYSYLFWEALNPGLFDLDEKKAFCVTSQDAESFLEDAAKKFGLNDKERTDFVSYWIPALARNPISLVQFFDAKECEQYARLEIEPKPDAEIRLFMIFKSVPKMVKTNPAPLPELRRGKFTVVEWGGANLDE